MVNNQNQIKCPNCGEILSSPTATKCSYCGHNLNNKGLIVKTLSITLTALIVGVVGYFGSRSFSGTNQDAISVNSDFTLLGDTFSGYSTFRNDEFQKVLKEKLGLNLQYEDEFDQKKRAELLNQGKADLLVTTLDQFLQQKPQGKIIGLIDRTVGADAIVLNTQKYPDLKSLLDLNKLVEKFSNQGKQLKIAFAGDTPSEYLALVLSTKFDDFKLSDFEVVEVGDASEAWDLLKDKDENVAVAIIWEPYVEKARKNGYTVLLSSKDVPNAIVDVIVASDSLISAKPKKLEDFLVAYYGRMDGSSIDSSDLKTQIKEDGGLKPAEATAVLQGINFFYSLEARKWLTDDTLKNRIIYTGNLLKLANRINQVPQNPQKLYNSKLIAKAAENAKYLVANNKDLKDKLEGKRKRKNAVAAVPNLANKPFIGNLKIEGEIKFATNSADMTQKSKSTLDKLAEEIAQLNEKTIAIRVIGHTSKSGNANLNQSLSEKRAQVVVDYLRSSNFKHKINSEGKGFNQPLPKLNPYDIRNQRTEIRVVRIDN